MLPVKLQLWCGGAAKQPAAAVGRAGDIEIMVAVSLAKDASGCQQYKRGCERWSTGGCAPPTVLRLPC